MPPKMSTLIRLLTLTSLLVTISASQAFGVMTPGQAAPTPARAGAWVDTVVISRMDAASTAISQLNAGALDVYAYGLTDPALYQTVKSSPALTSSQSMGTYMDLTLNPAGPVFNTGKLNPFANPAIREALNWLVDRSYISQQFFGGLAIPRFLPIPASFPDYARYQSKVQELEAKYAYNLTQANTVISTEMSKWGAYKIGGKYYHNGSPVTLIFLIRTEDQRRQIGDYVANQLEMVGFTVDRQYKTRAEASPIWNFSNPADGLWHMYTGGWIDAAINRDVGSNFGFFYTPLGQASPLWQAYQPSAEFYTVAQKLWNNNFSSMSERDTLFNQALDLALKDSVRVWLSDQTAFNPRRGNVVIAPDLVGGVVGSQLWSYTIRLNQSEGGLARVALPGVHVNPWNPLAGSNWIYDAFARRATTDSATLLDPRNGLAWPQRIQSAAVTVQTGIPAMKTLDWVSLSFIPNIEVPADAWVDWDAVNQRFITASEKYTTTITARVKSTVTYPADLFQVVKWHDGSPLSVADFVMRMIMRFDPAKPASDIYDQSAVPAFDSFMSVFKGVKIVSTNPLVIETYKDYIQLDAELMVDSWWPDYGFGEGAWHNMALGYLADASKTLAFSSSKANLFGVEWMDFTSGPSLPTLSGYSIVSQQTNYIPYANTMNAYVSPAEAAARWSNLQAWKAVHGHFWIGTGPFYLDSAYNPAVDTLTLQRYPSFPDPSGKWDRFNHNPSPAELTINYTAGAPGSAFNLVGSSFPFNRFATIGVNQANLGSIFIGETGIFTFTLTTTPQANEGVYFITATVNPLASTRFELNASLPLWIKEGNYPTFALPTGLVAFKNFINLPFVRR